MQPLSEDALQKMIQDVHEDKFQIIDVRRPEEFGLDHIPGALNIPLYKILENPDQFLANKDKNSILVFCCRHGVHSKVAALVVSESGYPDRLLYNLTDGMMDYTGELLLAPPRMDLFDTPLLNISRTAFEMEKGACFFYEYASRYFSDLPVSGIFKTMMKQEINHARLIFTGTGMDDSGSFDAAFENCSGDILEGGRSIRDALDLFKGIPKDKAKACTAFIDFALELEYQAYDLYKIAAQQMDDPRIRHLFVQLAQLEKKHLQVLIQALDRACLK